MAKKKSEINEKLKSAVSVETYEHAGSKRLNNPQVGLVNTKTEKEEQKKTYRFDPHLSPQLQWSGKEERTELELPTVSLHVHERIDPKTIIEAVRSSEGLNWEQLNLFNRPINKLNFIKEIQFYQHEKDWSNRMIAGDSLLVMNSLLEKESMEQKVQMIFFDPPYGIKYGSNFQPFINNRDVKDGKDIDLTSEPETLKAFRDTWELGVHSYLSYLRDRLVLCHKMLNDSGSLFLQISDENLHHVREILDETFGSENFVRIISFQKTGGSEGKLLASTVDFLIWYAKDIKKIKYHQLYKNREIGDTSLDRYDMLMLVDGSTRRMTKEEIGTGIIPSGARRYQLAPLYSEGASSSPQVFEFNGKKYVPRPDSHWKTTVEGLQRLALANRIEEMGTVVRYRRFVDDFPVIPITDRWESMQIGVKRMYSVQTAPSIIERCILMTTDPGDLVFDPTCGSGTTALVAEEWGRKWITCDTSRVAITLAKQRLMTQVFDYFSLKYPEEGVSSGFIYKTVPHVMLGGISNNPNIKKGLNLVSIEEIIKREAPQEELVDQPLKETKKVRVTGPFTMEAVPAPVVRQAGIKASGPVTLAGPTDWINELQKTGVRLNNKKYLKFSRLESFRATKWIHADGETDESPAQRVVVSFGPDFAPLEQRQVELVLQEAEKLKPSPTVIIFAAFQFDPEAAKDIDEIEWGGVTVLKVQMNADLFSNDLKKKRSSNESFWLIGQPDIEVNRINSGKEKGKYKIVVNGFDYYNSKTGAVESGGSSKIAMWLLDTDYDGRSLLPRQVFFPMAGKDEGWAKLAKSLRAEIDQDLIEAYRGIESLPFLIGEHKKIAVKIIDDRGIESLIIKDLET